MNIASALLKQILVTEDFETWSYLRKEYLPSEYHKVHEIIEHHCENFHSLPGFDDLELSVRHAPTREKILAIQSVDIDIDPDTLLEYLKNEYTQKEILSELETFIDESVLFATADESVNALHDIVLSIENKVDLEPPQESMQRIKLFEPDEEIAKYLPLGLNSEYDYDIKFSPRDLVMVGGRRGSGKSLTCANIAVNVYNQGRSAIYFTIEMDSRAILQRICSIATEIPYSRLKTKSLSVTEWEKVAGWWADRYDDSSNVLESYREHRDFEKFHTQLYTTCKLKKDNQIEVIYDPSLTLGKIRAELDKKARTMNAGVVIVDYINQVKRSHLPSRGGQYDWSEQIEVSKALKSMAQEYEVTVFSPYQTDSSGEARFAKGILDAADAAYAIETYDEEDGCMTFNCVKMRAASMKSFTSTVDWETLKIGPDTAMTPQEKEVNAHKVDDDDPPF